MIAMLCLASLHAAYGNEPAIGIIFDSDVDHDCDDIGALYILHGGVERGEAKLLATMGCTSSVAIAPCLDAINTWFGRPEIPVGTLKDEGFLDHKGFANEILQPVVSIPGYQLGTTSEACHADSGTSGRATKSMNAK